MIYFSNAHKNIVIINFNTLNYFMGFDFEIKMKINVLTFNAHLKL